MIFQLTDDLIFPPPELASEEGLLAVGGDLSIERLVLAYSKGIFPWYGPGDPILWWSPDPRLILEPAGMHVPGRLARTIRQGVFQVTFNTSFPEVIKACASTPRRGQVGTWIGEEMIEAYSRLHEAGYAYSVESWREGKLVGGLYGVCLGKVFFGESMFSLVPDSSKVALAHLARWLQDWNFDMIDCQMKTEHLVRLGAREITGREFRQRLARSVRLPFNDHTQGDVG